MKLIDIIKGIRYALLPETVKADLLRSYGIDIRLDALSKIGGVSKEAIYNEAVKIRLATGDSLEEILDTFLRIGLSNAKDETDKLSRGKNESD